MTGGWKLFMSAVLVCGAAACGTAASAPGRAPSPSTRPAREKAPAPPARGNARVARDTKAANDARIAAAVAAVEKNGLAAFASSLEPELTDALRDLSKLDLQQVTALAAYREFGRYFGRITALK